MDTDQSDSVQRRHGSLVVDDWNATQLAIPRERQHYDDEVATANPGGTAVRISPEGGLGAPNLRIWPCRVDVVKNDVNKGPLLLQ